MNIGTLRHRITIQKFTLVQAMDGSGDREQVWQDVKTVWAAIKPMSVRDFVAARAEQYQVATRIIVRFTRDIDVDCRIFHPATGLYYRIVGILPDQDSGKTYLTLACEAGVYTWQDQ